MIVFNSERLVVKTVEIAHKEQFIELLSANEIITAIPQKCPSKESIDAKFHQAINFDGNIIKSDRSILGVFEKDQEEMIGLVAFLTNNEGDRELGYRFRKKYWGKGYATEITKKMIDYSFSELNLHKITADVWVENIASNKVLSKFLNPVKEFYNNIDNCTDRRYELLKKDWN